MEDMDLAGVRAEQLNLAIRLKSVLLSAHASDPEHHETLLGEIISLQNEQIQISLGAPNAAGGAEFRD
jgi:hypothetical protein